MKGASTVDKWRLGILGPGIAPKHSPGTRYPDFGAAKEDLVGVGTLRAGHLWRRMRIDG